MAATPKVADSARDGLRMNMPGGPFISKTPAGNAEARNPSQVAGLSLIGHWIFLRTVNQAQFLIERHLALLLAYRRITRVYRYVLGHCYSRLATKLHTTRPLRSILSRTQSSEFWHMDSDDSEIGPLGAFSFGLGAV